MDNSHTPLTKEQEERKRDAVMANDPIKRWQAIQAAITWIENNAPEHMRRNRPRTRKK